MGHTIAPAFRQFFRQLSMSKSLNINSLVRLIWDFCQARASFLWRVSSNRVRLVAIALLFSLLLLPAPANADTTLEGSPTAKDFFTTGVTAFQAQDYQSAADYFTQAIALDPDYGSAYNNRCLAHLQLKNYRRAIADCTQGIELTKNIEAFLNRGLAHYRSGAYEAALADYSQVLQAKPHDARAYYNRGLAQVELGSYREAIVDYGEALRQVSPLDRVRQATIYNDRGLAQLLVKNPQQAIADFTQAIQFNGKSHRAYYNRGCVYHQQGNIMAALDDFTEVLALDPQDAETYVSRGLLRHQVGQSDGAIADLQKAAQCYADQGLKISYQQVIDLIERLKVSREAIA